MKSKSILVLSFALIFGFAQSARAQTNRQVKVQINQTEKIFKDNLTIKFVSIVEDSRCPTDMQCYWAGSAKIKIEVGNRRGASKIFELNTNVNPRAIRFSGYEIKFIDLAPKPATNIRIDRSGYTATMIVSRTG